MGTPLKDWDINIYRGVLTGYNEAFIISTEKREEILANCQSEDERTRTAELIRPILRGRDIKRYGYEWAGKYLIATFPSRHYDIEQYPAIKQYLLSFGKERLEQTGKTYSVNGKKVKARKKTNNKWFETQDSINYWEEFNQPKMLYPDIMRLPRSKEKMNLYPYFVIDKKQYIPEATLFMMTGKSIELICNFLCSQIGFFTFTRFYMGPVFDDTGFRYKKEYLLNLPIPYIENQDSETYDNILSITLGLTENEKELIFSYKDTLLFDDK